MSDKTAIAQKYDLFLLSLSISDQPTSWCIPVEHFFLPSFCSLSCRVLLFRHFLTFPQRLSGRNLANCRSPKLQVSYFALIASRSNHHWREKEVNRKTFSEYELNRKPCQKWRFKEVKLPSNCTYFVSWMSSWVEALCSWNCSRLFWLLTSKEQSPHARNATMLKIMFDMVQRQS